MYVYTHTHTHTQVVSLVVIRKKIVILESVCYTEVRFAPLQREKLVVLPTSVDLNVVDGNTNVQTSVRLF